MRQLAYFKAFDRVFLVHVDVVDDVQNLVGLVDLAVLRDLDEFQWTLLVPVLEPQVEGLHRV